MPGDFVLLASVHGFAAAELLREVLVDGGIESVDIRASVGTPYVARAITVEYDVRVADEDEARARALLAAYSEEASAAATAQANDHASRAELDALETSPRLARQTRTNVATAFVVLAVMILPALVVLIARVADYLTPLLRGGH